MIAGPWGPGPGGGRVSQLSAPLGTPDGQTEFPAGNILINSDFEQDVPFIRNSIQQLGFKYKDTKIVLISHAHGDHDAATGLIKRETDAKLMVMDADVPEEESAAPGRPGAHVDRI